MISLTIDPIYIEIGLPAAGIGLLVGVLVTWLVMHRRRKNLRAQHMLNNKLQRTSLTASRKASLPGTLLARRPPRRSSWPGRDP